MAHYLLLAALCRICEPGPKTDVAAWYDKTILPSLWHLPGAFMRPKPPPPKSVPTPRRPGAILRAPWFRRKLDP